MIQLSIYGTRTVLSLLFPAPDVHQPLGPPFRPKLGVHLLSPGSSTSSKYGSVSQLLQSRQERHSAWDKLPISCIYMPTISCIRTTVTSDTEELIPYLTGRAIFVSNRQYRIVNCSSIQV